MMKTGPVIQNLNRNLPNRKSDTSYFEMIEVKGNMNVPLRYFRKDSFIMYLHLPECSLRSANIYTDTNRSALVITAADFFDSSSLTAASYGLYLCVFTRDFLKTDPVSYRFQDLSFMDTDTCKTFCLTDDQVEMITRMFEKMQAESTTNYPYRYDLIRNYMQLVFQEAFRTEAGKNQQSNHKAALRIVRQFIELLDQQFPIPSTKYVLKLKTPRDYAEQLHIHVNHLNSAVRTITGKTTSEHITDRIIKEAQMLLKNTDWNVSEIAYCLGFSYPTYFNNFFKKHTQFTPLSFRPY